MINSVIVQNIRTLLAKMPIKKKPSYKKIGDALGVSEAVIKNYMSEKTPIPTEDVAVLARFLQIDVEWLMQPHDEEMGAFQELSRGKAGRPPAPLFPSDRQVILNHFKPIIAGLELDKEYRLFIVEGNSMMHSINQGDYLLCKKVDCTDIQNGRVYVLVLGNKNEMAEYRPSGIWVKRCYLRSRTGQISCKSDYEDSTEPYITFQVNINEVTECWYPVLKITGHMADPNKDIYDRLDKIEERLEILEQ